MRRGIVVAALGSTQTLAWASSYYLPAILADPIAQRHRLITHRRLRLFLGALPLSAVLGPAGITVFALLGGAGNGLLTSAKGTLPLAIFGPLGVDLALDLLRGAPGWGVAFGHLAFVTLPGLLIMRSLNRVTASVPAVAVS
jgi:hypothetical protein